MIHDMMPGTEEQLNKEMTAAYVGIDPTADSLHIGHLVSIMMLKHFQLAGHKPIALVGGATGMIGDPSGKSEERNLLDETVLRHNQDCIKEQLYKFLDFDTTNANNAEIVNNYDWMKEFSKLSNSLLDISKYDAKIERKYEPILINELLKNIVEKNKNLAHIKNINIETKIESSATIEGDKNELNRVFFNILDNAIKYTKEGGTITISDKIVSDKYIIEINDSGVGIPEDILGKIFDPFFRGDTSRNTEGAGLGLTLSKKIIENHKGIISIKSQINKGTNVIISLPISSR